MYDSAAIPRHRFTELNGLPLALRLGSFSATMLGWGFIDARPWRNYLHTHSFFEICYAFAGRGTFRILGHDLPVAAGDLFVAKPAEPHEIIAADDAPLGIYFWYYTLVPPGEERPGDAGTDGLLRAFLRSESAISQRTAAFTPTLELLTAEIVGRQPGYAEAVAALTTKLLLDTARAVVPDTVPAERPPAPTRSVNEATAQRIVRFLQDNYSRSLAVRDVAAEVHLSERHTSRLFRRALGVSLMDYLTTLRLEAAAQLLLDRRLSIKAVAQASGFPSAQHFSVRFRQHTGLSPAAFRHEGGTSFLVDEQAEG